MHIYVALYHLPYPQIGLITVICPVISSQRVEHHLIHFGDYKQIYIAYVLLTQIIMNITRLIKIASRFVIV